jgi:uncharacterized protein (TIRG00374 family)
MSPRTGLVRRVEISLLVIVALFRFIDLRLVADRLRQLRPAFLTAIFAIVFAQNVRFALRCSFAADFCGSGIRNALAVRFTIVSMFFNQTLPGTLGGDSNGVLLSAGEGIRVKPAFLGVVIDRVLALIVLIGLVVASLPVLAFKIVETRLVYNMAGLAGALVLDVLVFLSFPAVVPNSCLQWRLLRVLIELERTTSVVLAIVPMAIAGTCSPAPWSSFTPMP